MPTQPRKIEPRNLADLVPFPGQAAAFPDFDAEQRLRELAESIRQSGLKNPIHVLPENAAGLPANTILLGHSRAAALKLLDHTEARVVVRYDLAAATKQAITSEFLHDNLTRRQMSALGITRVLIAVECNRLGKSHDRWLAQEQQAFREMLMDRLAMSEKNVRRYINVVAAPTSIQRAFETQALTLVAAAGVGAASRKVHDEIEALVNKGQPLKKAIAEVYARYRNIKKPGDNPLPRVCALLRRFVDFYETHNLAATKSSLNETEQETLKRAQQCFKQLQVTHQRTKKAKQKALNELCNGKAR